MFGNFLSKMFRKKSDLNFLRRNNHSFWIQINDLNEIPRTRLSESLIVELKSITKKYYYEIHAYGPDEFILQLVKGGYIR